MAKFRDQVVVITGASTGIGEALAYRLAEQGAKLALAARNLEKLGAVGAECGRRGVKTVVLAVNVRNEAQCKGLIDCSVGAFGRIDMLVNNAGFGVRAPFGDLPSLELFQQVLAVNFMGSVYCTFYALPHLKQSRGRIVAISSLAGRTPLPLYTAYTASKHAMAGFFDALRIELDGSGVSVTTVYPDFVATHFASNVQDASGRPRGEEAGRKFYNERTMTADTCARIILEAAARRKREVTTSRRGRLIGWLKLMAPGLLDRLTRKALTPKRS